MSPGVGGAPNVLHSGVLLGPDRSVAVAKGVTFEFGGLILRVVPGILCTFQQSLAWARPLCAPTTQRPFPDTGRLLRQFL